VITGLNQLMDLSFRIITIFLHKFLDSLGTTMKKGKGKVNRFQAQCPLLETVVNSLKDKEASKS